MFDQKRIFILEDDPDLRAFLETALSQNGFVVASGSEGRMLRQALTSFSPSLIVMDLSLPDEDGFTLIRQVRTISTLPIIVITGNSQESDCVLGLELGADDYITKPFSLRDLVARIRAVLRRSTWRDTQTDHSQDAVKLGAVRFAGWCLYLDQRRLRSSDGADVTLTKGEFNLLAAFARNSRHVLTRAELLHLSRRYGNEIFERSLDIQILRLRRKIEENPSAPKLIQTVRGTGYRFTPEVEAVSALSAAVRRVDSSRPDLD